MKYAHLAIALMAVFVVAGCGDDDPSLTNVSPTPTPTPVPSVQPAATPPIGPKITFVGVARADDALVDPTEVSPEGVPVYTRLAGATGGASGFRLVVEGKPGTSNQPVALSTLNDNVSAFPDLQIQTNRPLGDGSAAVCDISDPTPGPTPGGVPAIDPPSFEASVANANEINDLACRFRDGSSAPGAPLGITDPLDSCVTIGPSDEIKFVNADTTVQFCGFVSGILTFPRGDTLLTMRLRDTAGNVGAPAQMIIRVN